MIPVSIHSPTGDSKKRHNLLRCCLAYKQLLLALYFQQLSPLSASIPWLLIRRLLLPHVANLPAPHMVRKQRKRISYGKALLLRIGLLTL
jgi:hypothetical protein